MKYRLKVYSPFGPARGFLTLPLQAEVVTELNEVSTLTLSYNKNIDNSSVTNYLNGDVEIGVEYYDGGWVEPDNHRFMLINEKNDVVSDTPVNNYNFLGLENLFKKVPIYQAGISDSEGNILFSGMNPGEILKLIIDTAQDKGFIPGLSYDFSATRDSDNKAWLSKSTVSYPRTSMLSDVIQDLTESGIFDYTLEGRQLRVFNPETALARDRNSVTLFNAFSSSAPTETSYADRLTHMRVIGDNGNEWLFDNNTTSPWGKLEIVSSQSGVPDQPTAYEMSGADLLRGKAPRKTYTKEFEGVPEKEYPFLDYQLGDWVTVQIPDGTYESQRIQTLSITVGGDSEFKWFVSVGDKVEDQISKITKKIRGLSSSATGGSTTRPGGSGSAPSGEFRTPTRPLGFIANPITRADSNGGWAGYISVTWNDDGKAAGPGEFAGTTQPRDRYEIQWWVVGSPASEANTFTASPDVRNSTINNVPITDSKGNAVSYSLRMRSWGGNSTRSSWTPTITVDMVKDTVPPPVPTDPVVTIKPSNVVPHAGWDGKFVGNADKPDDFRRVELQLRKVEQDFDIEGTDYSWRTQTYSSSKFEYVLADTIPGRKYQVRLGAYDTVGNFSGWSNNVEFTAPSVVDREAIEKIIQDGEDLIVDKIKESQVIWDEFGEQLKKIDIFETFEDQFDELEQRINDSAIQGAVIEAGRELGELETRVKDIYIPVAKTEAATDAQNRADAAKLAAENAAKAHANAVASGAKSEAIAAAKEEAERLANAAKIAAENAAKSYADAQRQVAINTAAQTSQTLADKALADAENAIQRAITQGGNVIVNPSFELGKDGWSFSPTNGSFAQVIDSATAFHGAKVMRITTDGNIQSVRADNDTAVREGETWRITLRLRAIGSIPPSSTGMGLVLNRIRPDGTNSWGTALTIGNAANPITNDWQTFEADYTIPAGFVSASFWLRISNTFPTGYIIEIDSASMVNISSAAEALAIAQAAQNAANQAHQAAGLAQDNASAAMNRADAVLGEAAQDALAKAQEAKLHAEGLMKQAGNMLWYGDLENVSYTGNVMNDSGNSRSGSNVFRAGVASGSDRARVFDDPNQLIPVSPGNWYRISYWFKSNITNTQTRFGTPFLFGGPNGEQMNGGGSVWPENTRVQDRGPNAANVWQQVSIIYQCPETVNSIPVTHFVPRIYVWRNSNPNGEVIYIDDLSVQDVTDAKQALDAAEEAEENAKNFADDLPKVLHGTTTPTGTAPNGSIWWRHQGSLQGVVIGQWNMVSGSWRSTPIASEAIANLDVGKLTAGSATIADAVISKLWADGIAANTISAANVAVAARNIIPNGDLSQGTTFWDSALTLETDSPPGFSNSLSHSGSSLRANEQRFPLEGGQEYLFEMWVKANKSGSVFVVELRNDSGGAHASASNVSLDGNNTNATGDNLSAYLAWHSPTTTWQKIRTVVKVNSDVSRAYLGLFYFNHSRGSVRDAKVSIAGMRMTSRVDGSLVVENSITAREVNAQSVGAAVGQFVKLDVKDLTASSATLNTAVANKLFADIFAANKITAKEISVTDAGNMIGDPLFETLSTDAGSGWLLTGATMNQVNVRNSASGMKSLAFGNNEAGTPTNRTINVTYPQPRGWQVKSGEKYSFEFRVYVNAAAGSGSQLRMWFPINNESGGYVAAATGGLSNLQDVVSSGWYTFTREITIPSSIGNDPHFMTAQVRVTIDSGNNSAQILFGDMVMRRMVGGTVIEPGAITTEKLTVTKEMTAAIANFLTVNADMIAANAVTSGKIRAGAVTTAALDANSVTSAKVAANAITANELAANSVTSSKIKAGSIDGMTITGSVIQTTSTSSRGLMMSSAGFRGWDNSGNLTLRLNGTDNYIVGRLASSRSGSSVIIEPLSSNDNPGIFFSSNGSASGNNSSIVHDNNWNLVIRGRRTSSTASRQRVEIQGGIYVTDGDITTTGRGSFQTGLGVSGGYLQSYNKLITHAWMHYPGFPTSTGSANVFLGGSNTNGQYFCKTSSIRSSKVNIEKVTNNVPDNILNLDPKTWLDRTELEQTVGNQVGLIEDTPEGPKADPDWVERMSGDHNLRRVPGLIAEEVLEAGLGDYVTYDIDEDTGEEKLSSVAYDRLWTLLIPLVREQRERIEALEAKLL